MRGRRPFWWWTVFFVVPGLIWLGWSRSPGQATGLAPAPAGGTVAGAAEPGDGTGDGTMESAASETGSAVTVVSVDEYSGELLRAALPPGLTAPGPVVEDGRVLLPADSPAPGPGDRLLLLRTLSTQFSLYRSWTLAAPTPPLAAGLPAPLSDIRPVWDGPEALGPVDIVQNDHRLLEGDVTVTSVEPGGAIVFTYAGESHTLAPGATWLGAQVRPPGGTATDTLAYRPEDGSLDEWLAGYLADGFADTVLTVTNHGQFDLADIVTLDDDAWLP